MFIPIGLEIKHKDVPWFTIFIVVLTTFISIYSFDEIYKTSISLATSENVNNLQNSKLQYLQKICESKNNKIFSTESCKEITSMEQRPGVEVGLLKKLQQQQVKKKDIKVISEFFQLNSFNIKDVSINNSKIKEHYNNIKQVTLQTQKKHHLLSKANVTPTAILKAQLTHSGWMHLIGNMIFLIAMCIAVEQRLGSLKTAGIYFLTGTIALPAYIYLAEGFIHIVGASANVFGIMGAFVTLFYNKNVKLLFSYNMMFYKTVKMPVLLYSLIFVIFSELVGLSSSSSVAHGAHLIGFVVGALVAYGFKRSSSIPDQYIYKYEYQLVKKSAVYLKSSKLNSYLKFIERHCKESKPLQKVLFDYNNQEAFKTLPDKVAAQKIFAEHIKSLNEQKNLSEIVKCMECFKSLSEDENFKKLFHKNFWIKVEEYQNHNREHHNVA